MLIANAHIITWEEPNRILPGHGILVENGRIAAIGPSADLAASHPGVDTIDAHGQFAMPGNICAHTHFYGAFARGLSIPTPAPRDFLEILRKLWWRLDKALTLDDIWLSAQVCLLDAIRHGTTFLVDHHASPNAIDGSLDVIAHAVEESGLRAVLCYEVTDRDGPEKMRAGIGENLRFNRSLEGNPRPLLAGTFGLHASLTLSDATLDECRAAAPAGTGFHVHTAEADADQYDSLARSNLRVVERLHRHGILGPRSIAAHAVRIERREIEILAANRAWVTHQPRSNMNNAVGCAPVETMLQAGVRLGLGNDGFPNAMWEEWKTAYLVHKIWHKDPRRMSGIDIVRMAIYNNASLAGEFFPQLPIGRIQVGAAADLILVDYQPFTPCTPDNLPWHILFGFHDSMITSTIVNGKILMFDRRILTMDEQAVVAHACEASARVWQRFEKSFSGETND